MILTVDGGAGSVGGRRRCGIVERRSTYEYRVIIKKPRFEGYITMSLIGGLIGNVIQGWMEDPNARE